MERGVAMLYEHNFSVYAALKEMLDKEGKAILITATGTGKSHIVLEYLKDNNYRALVVSPRLSINQQWEELSALIDTVTYQSFGSMDIDSINAYDCVVFDEAHHCGSPIWGTAVKLFMDQAPMPVIGLTADSKRWTDGGKDIAIEVWDGCIVRGFDQGEAIQQGILPRLTYVCALFDCAGMAKKFQENNQVSDTLKKKLNFTERNCESVVSILRKHISQTRRKGIVFAAAIKETATAEALMREAFPQIPVLHAHSGLPQMVTAQNIQQFKVMSQGFLITVDMLNEGVHIDGIDTIVMLRRTVSPNLYMQQCGRGLASGGKNPVIFDFVGNRSTIKSVTLRIEDVKKTIKQRQFTRGQTVPGEQVIVYDYTRDFLSVIDEIKASLARVQYWSPDEEAILTEFYPTEKGKVANRLPGRTPNMCYQRAKVLGLSNPQNEWSKDELDVLQKYYPIEGTAVSNRLPNRTPWACRACAMRLNIPLKGKRFIPWTPEEDEILRRHYSDEGQTVQKRIPNHTAGACIWRARMLGLKSNRKRVKKDSEVEPSSGPWTKEELEILKKYYPVEKSKVAQRLIGRSGRACISKANKMGIAESHLQFWTKDEEDILRKYYPEEGRTVANRLPNRNANTCVTHARLLGINGPDNSWTEGDDAFLREHYLFDGPEFCATELQRTPLAIKNRARILRLLRGPVHDFWTAEEDAVIKKFYPLEGSKVSERLKGRSRQSCIYRARRLGLA